MILYDCHVHTSFSSDSTTQPELQITALPESADSAYEFVEDEEELEDMFRIFSELMSDAEIDFQS